MSKSLISTTEKYRIDTEDEVNDFITKEKEMDTIFNKS